MRVAKCCCCNLTTGVFVIGWLGLIAAVSNMVNAFLGADSYSSMINREGGEANASVANSIKASLIITAIVEVATNIALLYGTNKRQRLFLLPWLIMRMITIVVWFIIVLVFSIILFVVGTGAAIGGGIAVLIFGSLFGVLFIWIWVCVHSLYKEFREEEERRPTGHTEEVGFIAGGQMQPPPYK